MAGSSFEAETMPSETSPITFSFTLDKSEHIRAARAISVRSPTFKALVFIGALLPPILLIMGFSLLHAVLPPVGVFVALYVGPRSTVRNFRKDNPSAAGPHHYSVDYQGIHMSSPGTKTEVQWTLIFRAVETKEFILLYISRGWGYCVPKRGLDSRQLSSLRKRLRSSLGERAKLWADN